METLVRAATTTDRALFVGALGGQALDARALDAQPADADWLLLDTGEPAARCSLWWRATPAYGAHRVGLIGHYAARDATAAARLLRHACDELRRHGCTLAVGPLDGNTYQRYRFVTERGAAPPFLLEPDNPDDWPAQFGASGFVPLARYCSVLQERVAPPDERLRRIAQRQADAGIRIRALDLARFDADVRALYGVVAASFARNLLHTPITAEAFVAQNSALRPYVVPGLVLLAERDGEAVGMLFGLPDWLEGQRAPRVTTAILKTVAVRPEYAGRGLVAALLARAMEAALELGYTRVIHALMHEDNRSLRLSQLYGSAVMRRYMLFARELGVAG
ncbi:MAG TPA: GNAT family N-acetyltransferase [Ktedonobacterales bacterium]